MRYALFLAVLALTALPVQAQSGGPSTNPRRAVQAVDVVIEGYGRASTDVEQFVLSVDPAAGVTEASRVAVLSYATNRAVGGQVDVQIQADLDGLVLDVEPVEETLVVERVASAGSPGIPRAVSFTEAGTRPFITGVGQVVAQIAVRYTVRSLPGHVPSGDRTITVTYTVGS